jgi:hypothetical protein
VLSCIIIQIHYEKVDLYFSFHFTNLCVALATIYPEHPWDSQQFVVRDHWNKKEVQLSFFNEFAKRNNIKNPEDWWNVTVYQVAQQGGSSILYHYGNSLIRGSNLGI